MLDTLNLITQICIEDKTPFTCPNYRSATHRPLCACVKRYKAFPLCFLYLLAHRYKLRSPPQIYNQPLLAEPILVQNQTNLKLDLCGWSYPLMLP